MYLSLAGEAYKKRFPVNFTYFIMVALVSVSYVRDFLLNHEIDNTVAFQRGVFFFLSPSINEHIGLKNSRTQ